MKMSESASDSSRFVVRKGAVRSTWMVWDRKIRGPAKTRQGYAVGLSEAQAHQVKVELMLDRGGA
jgi:hypothetical protein